MGSFSRIVDELSDRSARNDLEKVTALVTTYVNIACLVNGNTIGGVKCLAHAITGSVDELGDRLRHCDYGRNGNQHRCDRGNRALTALVTNIVYPS